MNNQMLENKEMETGGVLLINKPAGRTSFSLVAALRRRLGIKKIGHAGTLDPFATGVMVMLLGRNYTRLSDSFLCEDKEYLTRMHLGQSTDTYDNEGQITATSEHVPSIEDVGEALKLFQGEIEQIPPMFSAKKVQGKKLYELARKGMEIERQPVKIRVDIELVKFDYPYIDLKIACSKGTYIRSLAHDIGNVLKCGAHLCMLTRTRSGRFHLKDCVDGEQINNLDFDLRAHIHQVSPT
jgi:tRNA pseudouridine55 synthase